MDCVLLLTLENILYCRGSLWLLFDDSIEAWLRFTDSLPRAIRLESPRVHRDMCLHLFPGTQRRGVRPQQSSYRAYLVSLVLLALSRTSFLVTSFALEFCVEILFGLFNLILAIYAFERSILYTCLPAL